MRRATFRVPEIVLGFLLGIVASLLVAAVAPLAVALDPKSETFWGLTSGAWTAAATVALVLFTGVLAIVAYWQIQSVRDEATRNRTIVACDRYDTDPILDAHLRALTRARQSTDLERNPATYKTRIATILNYLDAIAIGIDQGLYVEGLARDHLEHVVRRTVELYIPSGLATRAGLNCGHYHRLEALAKKWS